MYLRHLQLKVTPGIIQYWTNRSFANQTNKLYGVSKILFYPMPETLLTKGSDLDGVILDCSFFLPANP
jgi:hypothetical protein